MIYNDKFHTAFLFTMDQLNDIYQMALEFNDVSLMNRILEFYTWCPLCSRLIPKPDFQIHFDAHPNY